jgi:ATP-dependent Clp protease adaptor protein ClpS
MPAARRSRPDHNLGVTQTTVAPAEIEVEQPSERGDVERDVPWVVIVWNDPINLMSYVTLVFQKLFGYSRAKATKLMLQVHYEGKAVVSSGTREKAEFDVSRLHARGLWATMRKDS